MRKWISSIIGAIYMVWYICTWVDCMDYMPYEAPFYIAFGLFLFIIEELILKFLYKSEQ